MLRRRDAGDEESDGEREVEERKTHASRPAVSCRWLGPDVGLLGVFIELEGFNPQYWLKPLAEGSKPTSSSLARAGGNGGHWGRLVDHKVPGQSWGKWWPFGEAGRS